MRLSFKTKEMGRPKVLLEMNEWVFLFTVDELVMCGCLLQRLRLENHLTARFRGQPGQQVVFMCSPVLSVSGVLGGSRVLYVPLVCAEHILQAPHPLLQTRDSVGRWAPGSVVLKAALAGHGAVCL